MKLKKRVVSLFGKIPNLNVIPPECPAHPLSDPYLGKQVNEIQGKELQIVFPTESLSKNYKTKVFVVNSFEINKLV